MTSPAQTPVVSVIVLTYNHERYIEQAVRSVLSQDFPQPFEIIVGEDCSTDATASCLKQLDRESPNRLTLLLRQQNLGLSSNLYDCWQRCQGKYIAILEGDDYWTSRTKLSAVAELLDAQPELSGCFHACEVASTLNHQKKTFHRPVCHPATPVRLEEMFCENIIQTYSVVAYRRGLVPRFPEWHRGLACGDWALHMLHAAHGPFGFLPNPMTVYRLHPGGMMSSLTMARRWQEYFLILDRMDEQLQGRYSPQILAARNQFIERVANHYQYLQRVERRYQMLGLEHVARFCRWLRESWSRRTDSPCVSAN